MLFLVVAPAVALAATLALTLTGLVIARALQRY